MIFPIYQQKGGRWKQIRLISELKIRIISDPDASSSKVVMFQAAPKNWSQQNPITGRPYLKKLEKKSTFCLIYQTCGTRLSVTLHWLIYSSMKCQTAERTVYCRSATCRRPLFNEWIDHMYALPSPQHPIYKLMKKEGGRRALRLLRELDHRTSGLTSPFYQ